jgi:tetratricopeptide (TPR) repeat protein
MNGGFAMRNLARLIVVALSLQLLLSSCSSGGGSPKGPEDPQKPAAHDGQTPYKPDSTPPEVKPPAKPPTIDELVEQGDAQAGLRRYTQALELYRKAAEMSPDDPKVIAKIAGVYEVTADFDKAIEKYRACIEKSPEMYECHLAIWRICLRRTKDEAEKTAVRKSITEEVNALLARSRESDALYAAAFDAYDATGEEKKRDGVRKALVEKFPQSKQLEGLAQSCFEIILRSGSDLAKRAGLCEQFVKDFPTHKMARMANVVMIRYGQSQLKDARKVAETCRRWIESNPEDPYALYVSSRVCADAGEGLPECVEWATRAVELLSKEPADAARPTWLDEGQFRDEVRLFEAYDSLGWAHFKSGDVQKGEEFLMKSVGMFNFNERAHLHLARLYESQQMKDKAIDEYAASLVIREDIPDAADGIRRLFTVKEGEDAVVSVRMERARELGLGSFTEVTEEAGLKDASGGRVAWGDYNGDGYQDILLGGSALWKNKGTGRFENVTAAAGIDKPANGGVWADVNNDGRLDFYAFGTPDCLWRQAAGGKFENVTAAYGVGDDYPTQGAGWGDYDRDGYVDLYCANYEKPGPELANGTPDFLWRNLRGEKFEDVSKAAGIVSEENMWGYGLNWGDYNNDGWLDIFVSNYRLDPNFLWRNNGNGTFTNVAAQAGVEGVEKNGYFGHTIGADWGDYDNDGDLDLFQANLAHPRYIEFSNMTMLLENSGPPNFNFVDRRKDAGIRFEETHSNPAWCDYDNDGFLDMYVTSIYEDVTWLSGTRVQNGWGCAWADYDNDGDMDLLVCAGGKARLFRNDLGSKQRHFLKVNLVGADCNRSAIGARVTVKTGTLRLMREVQGGSGTGCQNSLVLHFGLGDNAGKCTVEVRWPCGRLQTAEYACDRQVVLREE